MSEAKGLLLPWIGRLCLCLPMSAASLQRIGARQRYPFWTTVPPEVDWTADCSGFRAARNLFLSAKAEVAKYLRPVWLPTALLDRLPAANASGQPERERMDLEADFRTLVPYGITLVRPTYGEGKRGDDLVRIYSSQKCQRIPAGMLRLQWSETVERFLPPPLDPPMRRIRIGQENRSEG